MENTKNTETNAAIPYYVVQSAMKDRGENDNYAVIRSDNDYRYKRTLEEANATAAEMQASAESLSPIAHTVQVIDLIEPDA